MMRFLKWTIGVLAVAIAIVFVIGWRLPESHEAVVEREYTVAPERLYQEIANPAEYPRWRSGVQKVEMLPDTMRMKRFREYALGDQVTYLVEENVPGRRWVTTIADVGLPYGGSWIFELAPTARGTMLRITEEGEVYNPLFRFVSKFIMGHTSGIERFHADLEKRLSSAPPS